jgi:hypothetical protein
MKIRNKLVLITGFRCVPAAGLERKNDHLFSQHSTDIHLFDYGYKMFTIKKVT